MKKQPIRKRSGRKSDRTQDTEYEPMPPIQYKAPSAIHENVVNNLRREKETIERAFQ